MVKDRLVEKQRDQERSMTLFWAKARFFRHLTAYLSLIDPLNDSGDPPFVS